MLDFEITQNSPSRVTYDVSLRKDDLCYDETALSL